VVYDPVVVESGLRGNEAESVGESKDYDIERVDMNLLLKMLRIVMRMDQFCGFK